ncbi:hypothetical protein MDAP_000452 [Mitosporidium daphniae]
MDESGEHGSPQEDHTRSQDESRRPQSLLKLTNLLIDTNEIQGGPDIREKARHDERVQGEEAHILTNLEKERKRMMTLERNRLAAIRSRRKKKQEIDMLIGSIQQLEKSESFLDAALKNLEEEKANILSRFSLDFDQTDNNPPKPQIDKQQEKEANK